MQISRTIFFQNQKYDEIFSTFLWNLGLVFASSEITIIYGGLCWGPLPLESRGELCARVPQLWHW
jgi:hypothetical protein